MNLAAGEVDVAALTARLRAAFPDLAFERAQLNDEGEDHAVLVLDEAWVFRFPRTAKVAAAGEGERRVLARLAPLTDVPVPRYRYVAADCAGYPMIAGEPLSEPRFEALAPAARATAMARLGGLLRVLHGLPGDLAGRLAPPDPREYAALYASRRERLAGVLGGALVARADAYFAALPAAVATNETALIHRDLTEDHILVDGGRLAGVIDFTDVGPGDPAFDFTFLWAYGEAAARAALRAYGADAALAQRSRWYHAGYRLDQIWWALSGARAYDTARIAAELPACLDALGV